MSHPLPRPDSATKSERARSYLFDRGGGHLHRGIDLPAPDGTPVYAAAAGEVLYATNAWHDGFGGYGKVIVVRSGDTFQLYAHLRRPLVNVGDVVDAGDLIGEVGRTKYTNEDHDAMFAVSGAHLHFEVSSKRYPLRKEAARMDPVFWLEAGNVHPLTRARLGSTAPVPEGNSSAEPPLSCRDPNAPPPVEVAPRFLFSLECPHCLRSFTCAGSAERVVRT